MEKNIISEDSVKLMLNTILNEEISKVKREDFARVQFKIEELQNSLNETHKELRKLQDSIPNGLKTIMNGRVSNISENLNNAHKVLSQLKDKIRQYKKSLYVQQVEEKKNK